MGFSTLVSVPLAGWQLVQLLSLACAPPAWFSPVVKLTSSWQVQQAIREGLFFQLSSTWQYSQFFRLAGNSTSLYSAIVVSAIPVQGSATPGYFRSLPRC